MIEGTAPPFVLQTFAHPTCSILQLSDRAGGGRGWVGKCFEDAGGAVPSFTDIYSLANTVKNVLNLLRYILADFSKKECKLFLNFVMMCLG